MFKFVYRGSNRTSSLDFAPNEMRSVYFDIQFWVKQLNYSLKKKTESNVKKITLAEGTVKIGTMTD